MSERWLPVPGYEGLYEVSNLARARSLYFSPPRILKPSADKDGYPILMCSKGGKRKPVVLHTLACRLFNGPPNPLHREAAHLNGDRTSWRADNLKWVSKVENHFHMRAHGTAVAGERHPFAKLTVADVIAIRTTLRSHSCAALGRRFGVSWVSIKRARNGQNWKSVTAPIPDGDFSTAQYEINPPTTDSNKIHEEDNAR